MKSKQFLCGGATARGWRPAVLEFPCAWVGAWDAPAVVARAYAAVARLPENESLTTLLASSEIRNQWQRGCAEPYSDAIAGVVAAELVCVVLYIESHSRLGTRTASANSMVFKQVCARSADEVYWPSLRECKSRSWPVG